MIGAEGGFDPCLCPSLCTYRRGRSASTSSPAGGRRRRLTASEKAAIVEESYADGTSVCGVARRHGLTSQQLFGWRRLARLGPSRSAERPLFVPVIVAPEPEPPTPSKPRRRRPREGASIELEIDGVVVRVGRDADTGAIAAVIGALKAGS